MMVSVGLLERDPKMHKLAVQYGDRTWQGTKIYPRMQQPLYICNGYEVRLTRAIAVLLSI
ncbi:hypothetical protein EPYR_02911 [Erwinia pyrifoliae DSM 12163]|nr:hypothetical protein EPYR_02911 [Erwinia pyrifoliae DSM 12163]